MGSPQRMLVPVLVVAILLAIAVGAASRRDRPPPPSPLASAHGKTLRFDPSVAAGDRRVVLAAIASARPQARALIDAVDGMVDVRVGRAGGHAVGLTEGDVRGYRVTLDLATVSSTLGDRGVARLVLHELGHVVDHALVSPALARRLDAEIPAGWGCDEGLMGACANRDERFAETFAKWALGDIGVNLNIGYKVPPPSVPLDTWGAPLARLAARVR